MPNPGARPGIVYVLVNPSLQGLVKVGRTEGAAIDRARELTRATGVPTPFIVVFEAMVRDAESAERFVHTRLSQLRCRVADNREFFAISPTDAIRAVLEAETTYGQPTSSNAVSATDNSELDAWVPMGPDEWDEDLETASMESPFYSTFEAARDAELGSDDVLEDHRKALRLFKQAAALGSIAAWRRMGDIYCFDEELADDTQALRCYEEGAERGDAQCYVGMARVFLRRQHTANAAKCWARYFSSRHFCKRRSGVGHCVYEYVRQVLDNGVPFAHRAEIQDPQIMNTLRLRDKDLSWLDRL